MSNPYDRAKGGRLTFKGGLAPLKSIDKKKKKKNKIAEEGSEIELPAEVSPERGAETAEEIYTIDAAKRMKYDELFPEEAKKFGYDPTAKSRSVEDALDDRVKKKADRYCK